jgi:hypothetical protein
MVSQIRVESLSVGQFLAGDRTLTLPWFQRSYAWGEPQVGRLLADIRAAMHPTTGRNRYFLGHIYLARPPGERVDHLIDGNQRITTLTILFSVLRDRLASPVAEWINDLVGTDDRMRLSPQPSIAPFLAGYVQAPGATLRDVDDDLMALSQTERTILNNREYVKSFLDAMAPEEVAQLATFAQSSCLVTVSTVDDPEEAWDMLATEEQTGLKHHDADRAKHTLLAAMPRQTQEPAARIWDSWVARIGRDGTQELLAHLRTIALSRRSTKPIEEDLIRIYRLDRAGIEFMEREFAPRAGWLDRIVKRTIGLGAARETIALRLELMSWLDHTLWVAPAIRWLETRGEGNPDTGEFFFLLDRLAWLLKISGADPVAQERRYIEVCEALRKPLPLREISPLDAEKKLVDGTLSNLRSRTFEAKRYSDLVMRRISLELGQDPGPLHPDGVTIEHILPRHPNDGTDWWRQFRTRPQIAEYANRLGNLAFLSRAENQLASAHSYEEKRRILAGSRFLLARDAASAATWAPDTIRQRTDRLIGVLTRSWRL